MPNIENITKWRDELLTTTARQGKGELRSADDRFCCLGIACEVAIKNGVDLLVAPPGRNGRRRGYSYRGRAEIMPSFALLPPAVVKWLGLEERNPEMGGETASALNDYIELPFREIARVITYEFLT